MSEATAERLSIQETLQQIPLFADLGAAETAQLCRSAQRISAKPGDVIIQEGAPGDALFVILSGELEISKHDDGREIVLATRKAGEFLGEMSLLEQTPRTASARAVRESELLEIGSGAFRRMIESNPPIATTILRTVASRLRSTEALLLQRERLASLGTLAAGLAHELNNPAAAIQRSSAYLREVLETGDRRAAELRSLDLGGRERLRLAELELDLIETASSASGAIDSGSNEERLIAGLEALGVDEPWEIAPALAAQGWSVDSLDSLALAFAEPHRNVVLGWLGARLAARQLAGEIQRSSQAISDIVRAVKSYAYLDQAAVQQVDLIASLEDTLMILSHKLKGGIEVVRDYEADLPRLEAYAGALNQVWTNIIDNAIDAMDGEGVIELRVRRLGDQVEVHIADSGPGIQPGLASRIFDPFFTTKAQGVGTGLGLHIAHNIVVNQHGGRIDVASRAGRTEFRISLPIRLKETLQTERLPLGN